MTTATDKKLVTYTWLRNVECEWQCGRCDAHNRCLDPVIAAVEFNKHYDEAHPLPEPSEIVRCAKGHDASREVVEDADGCPYCIYTPGERQAALKARQSLLRRLRRQGRLKEDE